jgi:hypothetical protein
LHLRIVKDLPFFRAFRTHLGRVVPQKVEPLQVTLPSLPAAAQEAEKDGGAAGMSGMAVDPIVGVM